MRISKDLQKKYLIVLLVMLVVVINHTAAAENSKNNLPDFTSENNLNKVVLSKEDAVKRAVKKIGPAVVTIQQNDELASGIIISSQGYIVTSNQVVQGEEIITVELADKQQFEAQLIGTDQQTGLAVVKIKAQDLPVADVGDSKNIRIGQLAIAIGSPYNLEFQNTITSGVISATNRQIEKDTQYKDSNLIEGLIQTDASINPGNRGGPLLNSQGEIIGINIDYTQGMGFSIPINKVKKIAAKLIKEGVVKRPWIGIYGTELTSEITEYYQLPLKEGVMIFRVIIDSPAEQVGLEKGDVIIEANHQEVTTMKELNNIISQEKIGSALKLLIRKADGRWRVVKVQIIEMPSKNIN
ncbi:MAG: S1C family serine protease [Bacillota bacterium]